ncbi:extensin [Streptomyces sp. NPDC058992]|uniref:extensin n=1 Tax=Streptomyces sp. NPDC058992 TaxID=3346688 RepID=UPI0036800942
MTAPTPAEARDLLTALTRSLVGVGGLALVFTAVNVTLFAVEQGIFPGIAILLDPMVALALATVLYADARLAAWGLRPPRWSAALRWFGGIAATLMNTWTSIWPDGQIGWPIHADLAGVILHGVPTVLLILLTETIAAYRRTVTPLLVALDPTTPGPPCDGSARSLENHADQMEPAAPSPMVLVGTGIAGPTVPDSPPVAGLTETRDSHTDSPADGDLWDRAIALDDATRPATGRPVSVWRLRKDLHIGPDRARQIREQLLARRPDPPPSVR